MERDAINPFAAKSVEVMDAVAEISYLGHPLEKEWTLHELLVRRVNSASVNVAGEVVGK